MKPMLYLASPYSADTLLEREQNVADARRRFIEVMEDGRWLPFCPHTHTENMEFYMPDFDKEHWMILDIHMLAKCDALWIVMPPDHPTYSPGVALELVWAIRAGMPVFAIFGIQKSSHYSIPDPDMLYNDNGQAYQLFDPFNPFITISKDEEWVLKSQLDIAENAMWQMVEAAEIPDPEKWRSGV